MRRTARTLLSAAAGSAALWMLYRPAAAGTLEATFNATEMKLQAQLEAYRVTHPYRELAVAGVHWRYMVGGEGSRSLLLLPGGAMVPDQYFELMTALEPDVRVIAPAYPPVPTMAGLVAGVAAILDTEHATQVALYGSGPGGYLAQCFVRRYPERSERVVLAHTGIRHHVGAGPVRALAAVMSMLPESAIHWGMWQLWRHELSAPPDTRTFWLSMMHDILAGQLSKAHLMALTRQFVDYNTHYHFEPADLAGWPGAILILESDHDEAFSADARAALRATYPQACVHTFHEAGLGALFTHTQEYVGAVRDFLVDASTSADVHTVPHPRLRRESLLTRHVP